MVMEWRTVIIGYPTIAKLIHGESVELPSFMVSLIPDDQLFNEHQKIINEAEKEE